MESMSVTLLSVLFCCFLYVQALAVPVSNTDGLQSQLLAAEKRPKYMETRDLSYFKEMMLIALDELVEEGKINPDVFVAQPAEEAPTEKRGARLGFCIKMSPSGSFVSRPCWKQQGKYFADKERYNDGSEVTSRLPGFTRKRLIMKRFAT